MGAGRMLNGGILTRGLMKCQVGKNTLANVQCAHSRFGGGTTVTERRRRGGTPLAFGITIIFGPLIDLTFLSVSFIVSVVTTTNSLAHPMRWCS